MLLLLVLLGDVRSTEVAERADGTPEGAKVERFEKTRPLLGLEVKCMFGGTFEMLSKPALYKVCCGAMVGIPSLRGVPPWYTLTAELGAEMLKGLFVAAVGIGPSS